MNRFVVRSENTANTRRNGNDRWEKQIRKRNYLTKNNIVVSIGRQNLSLSLHCRFVQSSFVRTFENSYSGVQQNTILGVTSNLPKSKTFLAKQKWQIAGVSGSFKVVFVEKLQRNIKEIPPRTNKLHKHTVLVTCWTADPLTCLLAFLIVCFMLYQLWNQQNDF